MKKLLTHFLCFSVLSVVTNAASCCQELQRKREERRQRESDIADEEIAFLKASGKVSTKPSNARRRMVKTKSQNQNVATKVNSSEVENVPTNTDLVSVYRITCFRASAYDNNITFLSCLRLMRVDSPKFQYGFA